MTRIQTAIADAIDTALDFLAAAIAELRGSYYITENELERGNAEVYSLGYERGYLAGDWYHGVKAAAAAMRHADELEDAADRGWVEGFDQACAYAALQAQDQRAQHLAEGYDAGYRSCLIARLFDDVIEFGPVGGIRA